MVSIVKSVDLPEQPGVRVERDALLGTSYVSGGVKNKQFKPQPAQYRTGGIKRWENKTPYTKVVWDVVVLCMKPPLAGCTLVVDHTGVGRPVVDMFLRAKVHGVDCEVCEAKGGSCGFCKGAGRIKLNASIRPVTITAGASWSFSEDGFRVSKKELVSVLVALLQQNRLAINPKLELAKQFVNELESFRVKVTQAANETFEAWRERDHDDIVLAAAIAAWVAERGSKQAWIR